MPSFMGGLDPNMSLQSAMGRRGNRGMVGGNMQLPKPGGDVRPGGGPAVLGPPVVQPPAGGKQNPNPAPPFNPNPAGPPPVAPMPPVQPQVSNPLPPIPAPASGGGQWVDAGYGVGPLNDQGFQWQPSGMVGSNPGSGLPGMVGGNMGNPPVFSPPGSGRATAPPTPGFGDALPGMGIVGGNMNPKARLTDIIRPQGDPYVNTKRPGNY